MGRGREAQPQCQGQGNSAEARASARAVLQGEPKHDDFYREIWVELGSNRINAMAIGTIPTSAFEAVARIYQLTNQEFDELLYIIRKVDKHYLGVIYPMIQKRADASSR